MMKEIILRKNIKKTVQLRDRSGRNIFLLVNFKAEDRREVGECKHDEGDLRPDSPNKSHVDLCMSLSL